jgi:hypothetical protein
MKCREGDSCFHVKTSHRKPKVEAQPFMRILEELRNSPPVSGTDDYRMVCEYV